MQFQNLLLQFCYLLVIVVQIYYYQYTKEFQTLKKNTAYTDNTFVHVFYIPS